MQLRAVDYHRPPIRLLNGILRGAGVLGLAKFKLDQDSLLARARKETGLRDFGDEAFLQPLRLLIHSLQEEADLNPIGRFMNRANILRTSSNSSDLPRNAPARPAASSWRNK